MTRNPHANRKKTPATITHTQIRAKPSRSAHQLEGVARVVLDVEADDLADHGVLAHEHGGGAAERETDLGHLVRPHIVGLRRTKHEGGGGGD